MLAVTLNFKVNQLALNTCSEGFKAKFCPISALLGLFWMIGMFVIAFAFGLVAVASLGRSTDGRSDRYAYE